MAEVKLTSGKGDMAQRLNDRLRNSGCDTADVVVKHGDGARRTYHNIHIAKGRVARALGSTSILGRTRRSKGTQPDE